MNKKYYTGIGSRQTPPEICAAITEIAKVLATKDYVLRSGGADGADTAFENGAGKKKEIYLPWKNFNGNSSPLFKPSERAIELASTVHPVWTRLSFGARALHARNCHQVLGDTLVKPSEFLICWTKDGKIVGGTRTALMLASQYNIPIINLADEEYKNITVDQLLNIHD